VSTMPVPGWTVDVDKTKLATPIKTDGDDITEAVTKITWTASSADTAIKPGQFQEFPVSLGPLPKTDTLVFKTLQTYSDGTIVRWIDDTVEGQPEPEHPAPVLKLAPAAAVATGATASAGPTVAAQTTSTGSSSGVAVTFGIVGAVLGLAGLVLGLVALTRTRRTA
jgi:hypothetical protein